MKRFVRILAVALAMVFCLTGCIVKKTDLYPDVTKYVVLGQYTGIEVDMKSDVSEAELLIGIENKLIEKELAEYVDSERLVVELGDKVNIDFVGTVDGVAFDGGTAQAQELVIGSGAFIEGFEEQLIGAGLGKSVTVSVTFPKNYSSAELAGKAAEFAVKINAIQDCRYDELTDEFVKTNFDYATVQAFRDATLQELQQAKLTYKQNSKSSMVLSQVMNNAQIVALPQDQLEKYKQSTIASYKSYAAQYGMSYEDFLSAYLQMSAEAFEQYAQESAESTLRQELVLQAIANAEQLTFTSAEYSEYLSQMAASYGYDSLTTLVSDVGNDVLQKSMLLQTALNFIADNAVEVY